MSKAGAILITGASSGIGRTAVFRMAEKGFQVFAGVRSASAAQELENQRLEEGLEKDAVHAIRLDVAKSNSIRKAMEEIDAIVGHRGLTGLVNNAGIAVAGPVETVPIERFREQFDVNFFGLIELTQAALPLLRRGQEHSRNPGQSRIVNVSSISGLIASPGLGAYSASKFALEAVSDALRRELRDQKIHVALVEPGPIQTPIWEKSRHDADSVLDGMTEEQKKLYGETIAGLKKVAQEIPAKALPPERVADAIEHALVSKRPKIRYPIGAVVQATAVMARLLPDQILDRMTASQLRP